MNAPVKKAWLDLIIEIHKFHINQLNNEPGWTLEKSSKVLNRSTGSISQALLIATYLRTYEKEIRRCSSMRDALAFVRMKQREFRLRSLDI